MAARAMLAGMLCVVAAVLPGAAGAASGDLDPSFGGDGVVTTSFGNGAHAYALAILPNGKIVVAGSNDDFALARYLPDGTLDPVLDGDGKVTTDFGDRDGANSVATQPNGRIVAAGEGGGNFPFGGDFALARYKRDGALDLTFGADGKVVTDLGEWPGSAADLVIQSDGKIVVVGTQNRNDVAGLSGDFVVVRYNPDGSLDTSFGSGGVVLSELRGEALGVVLQPDGKIVVAGYSGLSDVSLDTALVRYEADGSLDPSFDDDGIAVVDLGGGLRDAALDVVVQADGKVVVAGLVDLLPGPGRAHDFLLARFGVDGSLDTQPLDPYLDAPFGIGGVVTTDFGEERDVAYAVTIEPGGKLVVAGEMKDEFTTPGDFALARYRLDGSLDPSFGSGGKVTTDISSFDVIEDVAVHSDGSIVVAGGTSGQFAVARYLALPCCIVGIWPPVA
jgi:uncharacterized delta-60 repeat protein